MIETFKPLLDSNIFLYTANRDSLYHKEAVGILERYIHSGFYVSDLNLTEFFQVITDGRKTKNPFEPKATLDYIQKLIHVRSVQVIHASSLLNIVNNQNRIDEIRRYNIKRYQIYDYLIADCMRTHRVRTIITGNDRDFRKFEFLEAINPFPPNRNLKSE
ncbi:MAG: type II toxin-antitoxin system VapC family toxin, partial [Bacteroidia bacterium]|nr:type II toxin-antitoxin system VapC family toxin [Bacteroidia bacterium]